MKHHLLTRLIMDRDKHTLPIISAELDHSRSNFMKAVREAEDKMTYELLGLNPDMVIIDDPIGNIDEERARKLMAQLTESVYAASPQTGKITIDSYAATNYPMVEEYVEEKTPNGMRQPPNPNKKSFTNVDRRIRTKRKKLAKKQRIKSCHTR